MIQKLIQKNDKEIDTEIDTEICRHGVTLPHKQFLLSFNITIRKPAVILHCVVKNDHCKEAPNRRIITTIGSC